MCFSATASFVASGTLVVLGGLSLATVKDKRELPLALIPIFFGIQQFLEGMLWLQPETNGWTYGFLAFAFVVWPLWLSFTPFLLEKKNSPRKHWMLPFIFMGLVTSAYLLSILLTQPLIVNVVEHSLQYEILIGWESWGLYIYLAAVCGAMLLSSFRIIQILGLGVLGSFWVSLWVYQETFASVWCFFAAGMSALVYAYFHTSRLRQK